MRDEDKLTDVILKVLILKEDMDKNGEVQGDSGDYDINREGLREYMLRKDLYTDIRGNGKLYNENL